MYQTAFQNRRASQLNSERVTLVLLWGEIERVICIKIERQSNNNNDGKGDKACAVGHHGKKGQQEHPKCRIVNSPNDCEWMRGCLFDRNVII